MKYLFVALALLGSSSAISSSLTSSIERCAACHGVEGNTKVCFDSRKHEVACDELAPRIAGQNRSYMNEQLLKFATRDRVDPSDYSKYQDENVPRLPSIDEIKPGDAELFMTMTMQYNALTAPSERISSNVHSSLIDDPNLDQVLDYFVSQEPAGSALEGMNPTGQQLEALQTAMEYFQIEAREKGDGDQTAMDAYNEDVLIGLTQNAQVGESIYYDGVPERGIVPCASCHGNKGLETDIAPVNIAGQKLQYSFGKMVDDSTKEIIDTEKLDQMSRLSDEEINSLATFLSIMR